MERLFENKKGLITGVFNKQSIAWAICRADSGWRRHLRLLLHAG